MPAPVRGLRAFRAARPRPLRAPRAAARAARAAPPAVVRPAARAAARPAARAARALRAFARDPRAAAGLELAFGAPVLLAVAFLVFDLYSRVAADTAGARAAAVMADYVSRGPDTAGGALDGDALSKLGEFLHEHELGVPADVVFVVTALRRGASARRHAVEVLWTDDTLRFGDRKVTRRLARSCSRFVSVAEQKRKRKRKQGGRRSPGGTGTTAPAATVDLPAWFRMDAGEVLAIVELCARPTREGFLTGRFVAGDIYRHHILPARAPGKPFPAPVHARRGDGDGAGGAGTATTAATVAAAATTAAAAA